MVHRTPRVSLHRAHANPLRTGRQRAQDIPASQAAEGAGPWSPLGTPEDTRHLDALKLADLFLSQADRSGRGVLNTEGAPPKCYCEEHVDMDALSDLSSLSDCEETTDAPPMTGGPSGRPAVSAAHRRWHAATTSDKTAKMAKGYRRLARKSATRAQRRENTRDAVDAKRKRNPIQVQPHPGPWVEFRGDKCERAVSKDGYDLAYIFPRAFRGETLNKFHGSLLDWAKVGPVNVRKKNDLPECYMPDAALRVRAASRSSGMPSATSTKSPWSAADIRRTGAGFEGAMKLLTELEVVSAYCTEALLTIDPLQYGLLTGCIIIG
ncbi:hypothetical protein C8Q76DRAFT_800495 [Earliella scabrosa]|nr:hypothetical protein C8Q76DRAFT_800495 [Earliella scabrosa]